MKVLNSKGDAILLNARETKVAESCERACNALGYDISITTLTTIMKKVSEQKFFEMAPADYLPIQVGEGAWSTNLTTYRSFNLSDDFSTGVVNMGGNNGRLAVGDTAIDALNVIVRNWAKSIGWSIMDLEIASKSGNWDLIAAKEKSRKKNWDLGVQKIAFLGLTGDSSVLGLYTQAGITNNTTLITQSIASMTSAQLNALLVGLMDAYRSNNNRTAWPTHFVIPESDYLGLAAATEPTFPIKTKIQMLEEALKLITKNNNFKILPCAYGDNAYSLLGVQRYALYNADEESLRMNIPVDYTNTLANSIDNFSFQNVGYGQFTGVLAYRPQELLYLSF